MDIKKITTVIDGYEVELEVYNMDGEKHTDCFIYKKVKGRDYSASMACLDDIGELDSFDGFTIKVKPQTIEAISKWAEENGY